VAQRDRRSAARYFIAKKQRKQINEFREKRCEECGWNAVPEVLELHHRDRNVKNGSPENLKLVCPNCHQIEHFRTGTGRFNKRPRNSKSKLPPNCFKFIGPLPKGVVL